ncbi:hypothetical protein [Gemmatimonas aurantiaca]|uniref:hypothetical protein n=1 Tax=Gemmatimonas aurantiaca TaxID=173480 RepID=UPI00301B7C0A
MSIELRPFPSPSVVIGDTLRNEAGVVTPVHAIVRNSAGDEIADARPYYLYADFNRDSAITVDSVGGVIVAHKALALPEGRIAARIGSNLQVLRSIIVTEAPDTVTGTAPGKLELIVPDTASKNTTQGFAVSVRHTKGTPSNVNGWVVRYQLLHPANPSNDTSAAAYLVSGESQSASVIDTTDSGGTASRRVRVRPLLFPDPSTPKATDSVVVQVTVRYKGQLVGGTPLRLVAPVSR